GMNVYGQVQASALLDEVAEDVILENAILIWIREAAVHVLRVDALGLRTRRIAETCGAEVRHLELHGDAAFFLVVFECPRDKWQIAAEIRWKLGHAFLLHPAAEHFL